MTPVRVYCCRWGFNWDKWFPSMQKCARMKVYHGRTLLFKKPFSASSNWIIVVSLRLLTRQRAESQTARNVQFARHSSPKPTPSVVAFCRTQLYVLGDDRPFLVKKEERLHPRISLRKITNFSVVPEKASAKEISVIEISPHHKSIELKRFVDSQHQSNSVASSQASFPLRCLLKYLISLFTSNLPGELIKSGRCTDVLSWDYHFLNWHWSV